MLNATDTGNKSVKVVNKTRKNYKINEYSAAKITSYPNTITTAVANEAGGNINISVTFIIGFCCYHDYAK